MTRIIDRDAVLDLAYNIDSMGQVVIQRLVSDAFYWETTPQGYNFWSAVYSEVHLHRAYISTFCQDLLAAETSKDVFKTEDYE